MSIVLVWCCLKSSLAEEMEDDSLQKRILTDWVYDCYLDELDAVIENDTDAMDDMMTVERFVVVAIWCLQEDPDIYKTHHEECLAYA